MHTIQLLLCLAIVAVISRAEDGGGGVTNCDDSLIEIQSVQVLCDSPGTYYYGQGGYRKAETCKLEDKAHLYGTFYISQDLYAASPYAYLQVDAYGQGEEFSAFQPTLLCQLGDLKSTSGATCPSPGYYSFHSKFYLSSSSGQSSDTEFVPYMRFYFSSDGASGNHDLGGANLKKCSDDSNNWWQPSVNSQSSDVEVSRMLSQNGLLFFSMFFISAFACVLYWQSRGGGDKQMELAGNDKILVDFEGQPL